MIAASEPLEFIPRGRQAVEEHPGSTAPKVNVNISSESVLLHRMQNVNISCENQLSNSNEYWCLNEIFKSTESSSSSSSSTSNTSTTTSSVEFIVNSEEEIYFKGNTAVWTRGIANDGAGVLPKTCFTCDSAIRHAFFCSPLFMQTFDKKILNDNQKTKIKSSSSSSSSASTPTTTTTTNSSSLDTLSGICLIDSNSLRIYLSTGEYYLTSLEFQVLNVWQSKFGILLQKDASCTKIDSHEISMPILFSLSHPLDEACPILIKSFNGNVGYLIDTDYKVIYADFEHDLVLLYDNRICKHFICRLRLANEEEKKSVCGSDTIINDTTNQHGSDMQNFSLKTGGTINKNKSDNNHRNNKRLLTSDVMPSLIQQSFLQSQQINRSNITSPLTRLQSTIGSQSHSIQDMRQIGQVRPSKPIIPELCLEHLWTESGNITDFDIASHGFMHTNLVGQSYLCYLLPRSGRLQMLRLENIDNEQTHHQLVSMNSYIPAKDAVCLKKHQMIAVLAPCGTLVLYTGVHMIGKVHVCGILSNFNNVGGLSFNTSYPRRSSLLPTTNVDAKFDDELHSLSPVHPLQPQFPIRNGICNGLKDAIGNRITLTYNNGKMYRISIPQMSENPFVLKCIIALRQVLKNDLAIMLMSKWFCVRNAPGTLNLNPQQEWEMFQNVLFESIGCPLRKNLNSIYGSSGNLNRLSSSSSSSKITQTSDEPKKRRINKNDEGTNNDWVYLLNHINSEQQSINSATILSEIEKITRHNTTALLFPYIPVIFYTLHLIYEDMKLDQMMQYHLKSLVMFLYNLALELQLDKYCHHYFLDCPELAFSHKSSAPINEKDSKKLLHRDYLIGDVPNVFKMIYDIVNEINGHQKPYPYIKNVNEMSRKVIYISSCISKANFIESISILEIIPQEQHNYQKKNRKKSTENKIPTVTKEMDIVNTFLDLNITRKHIEQLPIALHFLFADSLENFRLKPNIECDKRAYELLLRSEFLANSNDCQHEIYQYNTTYRNIERENSLSPRISPTPDVIPKSDVVLGEDGMEHMDTKLLLLRFPDDLRINEVRRLLTSSKPVTIDIVQSLGVSDHDFIEEQEKQLYSICTRTMALPMGRGMFTLRTCTPASTELLSIPKLCLTGKESLKGATVELQQIEVPYNMNMWPLFHNGVAAGLQITPDSKDIDSTWIVYNKPKVLMEGSSEHGGFLMALGLNGHLSTLSFMSIYEYLIKCEEMTSVGLLLGISAAHRGTMDITTTKLLSVHIEALLPATALELDIPQNIQVAAIMGIGMIYQETAKRHMAEILLQEIGRPPGPEMENCVERESYALTAGLALGLVTLGQGEMPTALRDLQLPDTLHYYMIGGNKRPLTGSQKEKYKLPSFQVREGETVNIDVTAPGAILALGLMFFKTGNQAVANWMKPPDTNYLLDLVRPDLLLLRILARGLILWDDVEATDAWLIEQFPAALKFDLKRGPKDTGIDIDHEANCQAYCNIITGASLCLGLRYAGSENPVVFEKLKFILNVFLNMSGQYIGEYAGKATVESCLVLVLLSMSLVYAGTGNLCVLRICRMLRSRLGTSNSHVTYGSQMAIHMALGFLFLGAGRFTLSRSPQAIAALVCSLFPKFPTHSNDNRYHLQAFRHLYVLAVEPRIFMPRDIDSGKLCLSNITYMTLDKNAVEQVAMAPCILPDLDTLKTVIVNDENYWPVSYERNKNWDQLEKVLAKCGCIDIKQKAGCLSHLDDPNRLKSLLAQTLTTEQYSCWEIEPNSLITFSNDPKVLNFTNKFLTKNLTNREQTIMQPPIFSDDELEIKQIITLQFYNSLTKDKMHALPIYMNILMIINNINRNPTTIDIWQMKIISSIIDNQKVNLVSAENVKSLVERVNRLIDNWCTEHNSLLKQYLLNNSLDGRLFLQTIPLRVLKQLVSIISFYELPNNLGNKLNITAESTSLNYFHYLIELKKCNFKTNTIQCIWKMLSLNK